MITATLTFPMTKEQIRSETDRLCGERDTRKAEIDVLNTMLGAIQKHCKHEHPSTGYNDRDGSWATPCIHCGYSY